MTTLRKLFPLIVMALTASPAALAQHIGFEFRGLRPGMTETEVITALNSLRKPESTRKEFPHLSMGKMCGFALAHDTAHYAAFMNSADVVSAITYTFETSGDESPESFVRVLSSKYGKPTIEQRTYTSPTGNQFKAALYTWTRGKQFLSVEEVCGEIGKHCVQIGDAGKIKPAKPEI